MLVGDPRIDDNENFDFIVVGASPSGSVIANRLSENRDWKVLLIEVGDEPSVVSEIPGLTCFLQFTNYSWPYYTEENNRSCLGRYPC